MAGKLQGFTRSATVTPNDSTKLAPGFTIKGMYVGVAGDVTMKLTRDSSSVLFKAMPVGYYDFCPALVASTGTTATNILIVGD